jgi:hypothetical protein
VGEGSAGRRRRRGDETVRGSIRHFRVTHRGGFPARAGRGSGFGSGSRGFGWGSRWCGSERTRAYLSVVLRGAEEVGADGVDLAVVLRDANLADVARAHRGEPAVRAHRGRPLGDAHRVTGDRAGGLTEHGAREERTRGGAASVARGGVEPRPRDISKRGRACECVTSNNWRAARIKRITRNHSSQHSSSDPTRPRASAPTARRTSPPSRITRARLRPESTTCSPSRPPWPCASRRVPLLWVPSRPPSPGS